MSLKMLSLGAVASGAAGIVVSGCTAAAQAVLTVNAGHGLKVGDRLFISGVTGFTNINGESTVVAVTSTTVTIDRNTVGQSTFGGTVVVMVICDKTPLMAGHSALVLVTVATALSGGTIATIQGSDDGSTFTDAKLGLAWAANSIEEVAEVRLYRYMRVLLASFSAGSIRVRLAA